jgi:hypothetical protein
MSVEFETLLSDDVWVLSNIYAPCTLGGKAECLNWLHDVVMLDDIDWLLVGDFNLIRRPSDRNKPRGNIQDMLRFNEVISHLGLEELPLQGSHFTWSNKHASHPAGKIRLVHDLCFLGHKLS